MLFASFFGSTLSSILGTVLISPLCSFAASPLPSPCLCRAAFFPSFHGNFQSHQRDSKWKVSFEFQRPDRTCCFHQPSRGPLRERPPSELIIPTAASCWPWKRREGQKEGTGSVMFLMVLTSQVKAAEKGGGMNPLGFMYFLHIHLGKSLQETSVSVTEHYTCVSMVSRP